MVILSDMDDFCECFGCEGNVGFDWDLLFFDEFRFKRFSNIFSFGMCWNFIDLWAFGDLSDGIPSITTIFVDSNISNQ
jgi:hypothetical protein